MNFNDNKEINQKPKKIIDWIKYRNMKESTINYTALTGLKRINKILTRFIKLSFIGFTIGFGSLAVYNHFQDLFKNRIDQIEQMISSEGEDEKKIVYLNNHIRQSIEYGKKSEMDDIEEKTGIIYYREKLLKNAKGLVLETCCGSFRNSEFYPEQVSNVK